MNDQVLILTPPKDEEEEIEDDIYDFPYEDVYVGDEDDVAVQIWFHGKKKSKTAEEIINNYSSKTSGCFLIRENDKNGYSISFWNNDKTCHCRINYKDGKYYLNQAVGFESIVEMVEFYQQTPLYLGQEKSILLSDPIPVEPDFLNEPWYHVTDRHGAENLLRRATDNGTFLIRPCGRRICPYSLSIIYNRTIRHFAISREGGLFSIGSFRFLSMEKLVDFFKKRPIAKQMVLKKPATSALLDADDITDKFADVNIYGDGIYAHVDDHQEKLVSVRALYDYIGDPDTQLSFKRGAIITNVMEIDDPWWKGDYGKQTELLFPANYVEVIDTEAEEEEKLRDITIPLETCILELAERCGNKRFAFKLYSSKQTEGYIFACDEQAEFVEWLDAIGNVIQQTQETKEQRQKQEQIQRRAKELLDLIVYCQSVPFPLAVKGGKITEMASLSESKMGQYNSKEKVGIMTRYNCKQLSRVYPGGRRVLSSNYDPVQMWSYGCQMVALNYQKADRFIQLNNALFLRNGRCGYVLKPECMRSVNFSPFEMKSFISVEPVTITVAVLCGRNIFGGKITTATNPFVSIEIIGLNLDINKRRTGSISKGSNSLSPIWDDQLFLFDVTFPDLAFLRFEILDESFEKTKTIHAQATYPLKGLRQGFRCVHLNNHFSEKQELSSLLVHIETKNPMEAEERNVFKMIEELRQSYASSFPGSMKKQLEETEIKLLKYLDERQKKRRRESHLQGSPGTRK
ncbi:1-phosphatidylinositol 4,5-bisphosphate phosphodiesterase gamma-1 [Patella vulgata]|uniref:1-phosphatidylinositol 4,5-bisphosphate phosphodiesterase gamma-1 n=1 Tax=Patella vulgata TaxID=6465 RepID=UPI0024A8B495|nr:1-phosphatidylinositol 4,5-bisphosphate phosphodiesterase gamma-1 [Patella vulgata]